MNKLYCRNCETMHEGTYEICPSCGIACITPGLGWDGDKSPLYAKYPAPALQRTTTAHPMKQPALEYLLEAAYQRGRDDEAKTCEEAKRHG